MDRVDFFFKQLVGESELDLPFEFAEQAMRNVIADMGLSGVYGGMGVTQSVVPGLSALIAAGTAYDSAGQRIRVPVTQTLSLALDSNGVSTTVGNSGNSKVISIFAQFTRANTDSRNDGNSQPVYFKRFESFALIVRQGAEATDGTETPPALEDDKILLADIKRTFGQTTILNANINPSTYTNRRQDLFVGNPASSIVGYRVNTIKDAIAALRDAVVETEITPAAALNGTSSAYNPAGLLTSKNVIVRQDVTGASIIRGIQAPSSGIAGQYLKLFNIATNAANTWTLNNQDGAETAANRIICPNVANFVIRAGGMASLRYDLGSSRWRVEAA